jgi:Tfp pilus assembly protein PilE
MAMVFCRGCGKEIHDSAPMCPHCGAPQQVGKAANSPKNITTEPIPDGVKGWSWGAFLNGFLWSIWNNTWIGLLVLIPYVNVIMIFVLGFKGREWAWKNKKWDSFEHFDRVQKQWSYWSVVIVLVAAVIGVVAAIAIPAYQSYVERAHESADASTEQNFVQADQVQAPVTVAPTTNAMPENNATQAGSAQVLIDVIKKHEAESADQWAAIQNNPALFLQKCKSENNIGSLADESRVEAMCEAQLTELTQCMAKASASAASCFEEVTERGD